MDVIHPTKNDSAFVVQVMVIDTPASVSISLIRSDIDRLLSVRRNPEDIMNMLSHANADRLFIHYT